MATELTTIFGNEIRVGNDFRIIQRQYNGFAGAHGLTTKHMGSRGSVIVVSGILRGTAESSYDTARNKCLEIITATEQYLAAGDTDYTFKGTTYEKVVWDKINIVPDSKNTYFQWNSKGECFVNFIATGRCLV
jgi:hypothetical protein